MSFATDIQALEVQMAQDFGQSVVLTHVASATYATTGTVTPTESTHTVQAQGPVSEAKRYAASGSDVTPTATFYVPALGLSVVPKQGDTIAVGSRTWQVIAVETFQEQGITTSYRLDCGEVGSG